MAQSKNLWQQKFIGWLTQGEHKPGDSYYKTEQQVRHTHPWYRVMCLTGVDYFSTLGYQPGIAALAAGVLSPVATLVLVLVTLFGALPMYRRVAGESPHGDGSISMLERLLEGWTGKFLVLSLIGFVATSFIITITLSAADASAHIVENPFVPESLRNPVALTLLLIAFLGGIFLKGFKEAIGIAVVLVVLYLLLSAVVVITGFYQVSLQPSVITNWLGAVTQSYANPLAVIAAALLVFPKLALGLSGFETGVVVMPLVKGDPNDNPDHPAGRIRNSRKLLTAAALIMSLMLITSSLVTTWLIPPEDFQAGGQANGRALAYLAHKYLGDWFGSLYDISTILILWFAGASAMAGLLNIVPRYLPRYGMAPAWARVTRPLVLIYTFICFVVTILFKASVDAQAAAYATGVLALMGSAAVAVLLSALNKKQRLASAAFGIISAIFIYTLAVNILEHPAGLQIALVFIAAVLVISFASRISRSTELRVEKISLDAQALRFIQQAGEGELRIIAHHRNMGRGYEYIEKEREVRRKTHIPPRDPVIFLEVGVMDASDFTDVLSVRGVEVGDYRVLRTEASAIPNAIAALLLHIRDLTGKVPHVYFEWGERSPIQQALRFVLFGEGDIAPLTHEVLRQAEPDLSRRPVVHVGG